MKLRTGLKLLIWLSILGIGIAGFLIYTCPFAGQISFSTLVHQIPGGEQHGQALVLSARKYPVEETKLFGVEVSPLGILTLLVIIGLCRRILKQRPVALFGLMAPLDVLGMAYFCDSLWEFARCRFSRRRGDISVTRALTNMTCI